MLGTLYTRRQSLLPLFLPMTLFSHASLMINDRLPSWLDLSHHCRLLQLLLPDCLTLPHIPV